MKASCLVRAVVVVVSVCGMMTGSARAFRPSFRVGGACHRVVGANRSSAMHAEKTKEKEDLFMVDIATETDTAAKKNGEAANANDLFESMKGAAMEGAKDLFVALRWSAANALTSALPETQRRDLLDRLNPEAPRKSSSNTKEEDDGDDDDDELIQKNSVSENVAAALAKESQREESKWEKEKETILAQAEQAARKRVESDLVVQKQRMEQEQRKLREESDESKRQLEVEKKALKARLEEEGKEIARLKEMQKEAQAAALKAAEEAAEKEDEAERIHLEKKEKEALKDKEEVEGLIRELEAATEKAKKEADLVATSAASADVHPILGPVVSDLGYKRIYLVSAEKLATIPVWKKQRIYRHERAKAMAADKLKTLHLGLPGVICIHEEANGKLSILDGQHRVGMMQQLQERQEKQQKTGSGGVSAADSSSSTVSNYIDLDRVLVEVYPQQPNVRNIDHAEDIFLEINKAEPIKLVDMPGVAKAKDRKVITEAVNKLQDKYPDMFSPSQRCRVPNLNVDNLRDNLFAANVIKRHNLTTTKKLLDWVLEQNEILGEKYEKDSDAQSVANPKAWEKASEKRFYLGIESSWLYN